MIKSKCVVGRACNLHGEMGKANESLTSSEVVDLIEVALFQALKSNVEPLCSTKEHEICSQVEMFKQNFLFVNT